MSGLMGGARDGVAQQAICGSRAGVWNIPPQWPGRDPTRWSPATAPVPLPDSDKETRRPSLAQSMPTSMKESHDWPAGNTGSMESTG